jgi:acetyl esterase/lipase
MNEPYGIASDGTPLIWQPTMPGGVTTAPWVLTIESAHWVEDHGPPIGITQSLVNAGYCAVHPLHRLAPPSKIDGQTSLGQYPDQTDDLDMAIDAALNDPRCDGRVALAGGSGGANIAGYFQAKGGRIFAAVLFSPATYLPDIIALGGQPARKTKNYAPTTDAQTNSSPLTYLQSGVSTPVMLVAFTVDQMPPNQFQDYSEALLEEGIANQSILLPGTGHSWTGSSHVDWIGFLNSYLPTL